MPAMKLEIQQSKKKEFEVKEFNRKMQKLAAMERRPCLRVPKAQRLEYLEKYNRLIREEAILKKTKTEEASRERQERSLFSQHDIKDLIAKRTPKKPHVEFVVSCLIIAQVEREQYCKKYGKYFRKNDQKRVHLLDTFHS